MKLTSRKLAGAIVSMLSVVGLLVAALAYGVEEALLAEVSVIGVSGPVVFWAIVGLVGLGGFQILRQARIDERN